MIFKSINPYTEKQIAKYKVFSPKDVEVCIDKAQKAFLQWRDVSIQVRSVKIKALALLLRERKNHLAQLASLEMGKTINEAIAEVEKCALACDHFADHGESYLASPEFTVGAKKAYVTFEPLGPILGVMPWNFPFWQVIRFAVPTLQVGNAVLIKHAPNTQGCAKALEELFANAGFTSHVYQNLVVETDVVHQLLRDVRVCGVSVTGSTRAGRAVAKTAGFYLKKCVLELGGSDPYLIFPDADVRLAAEKVLSSRLQNAGQSCVAAKRVVVHKSCNIKFRQELLLQVEQFKLGDPQDKRNQVGPLARRDLREQLKEQVKKVVKSGCERLYRSEVPKQGYFYPVEIYYDESDRLKNFDEELFGPVLLFRVADSEEAMIAIANNTAYGLGAAIFSRDVERAEEVAKHKLAAGMVFINDLVRSQPQLPFGGIKSSGIGRELSVFGMHEFVNIKTISL